MVGEVGFARLAAVDLAAAEVRVISQPHRSGSGVCRDSPRDSADLECLYVFGEARVLFGEVGCFNPVSV